MPPKPHPFKNSTISKDAPSALQTEKDAFKAMPPPPDPPTPSIILGPEINGLSVCLKNAAVKTGQVYSFYADTHKLGIERHAPNPPRSLTSSLGREVEKYDQLCDSIESQLLRAISVLQRDLDREEQRLREIERASIASQTRPKSKSLSPTSTQIPLPEKGANSTRPTPTNSPPAPNATVGPGRRPSAISISSLHRPAFPLKLDLSSSALRITPEEASLFSSGLASPVTLAPKSARALGPDEFPPDLMAAFASSSNALHPTIDLTAPENDQHVGDDIKMQIDTNAGNSADKPIELDLEAMDIDMAMTDLFGDLADNTPADTNTAVDSLFSPVLGDNELITQAVKTENDKAEGNFFDSLNQSGSNNDLFASLVAQGDSTEPQPVKNEPSSQSVPSPGALLDSFPSSSQLQGIGPSPSTINAESEPQFEFPLDLSTLSPGFFGNGSESNMNFPMDMEDFLNMGGREEEKQNIDEIKSEPK